jgi:hypothetical protein
MKEYDKKSNNELIKILNDFSDEYTRLKQEVEKTLFIIDELEKEYMYVQEIIKKRMGK